ncbi:ankyrin repeat-containing protein ITN1-like protein [Cinnamomum micranthum f. kanehirae]|uniref:Ankyrin repeat-containing protein ITN1-like protein n=1 Tax=Cinnamomum micranthum f. kanehirae TaxID=337451 RepID=A0A443Q0Z3_9MAGN|nr:ankyrin repeat-containing protein ITN1-like protein [Cinnamomum micranthum f. kanehirae]
MHTWAFQVMQELVTQANSWEYEETGSQPHDLKEIRGRDKEPKAGAFEFSPPNIPPEVEPKMGGSTMNQAHVVAASVGASTSTGAKQKEDANGKQEKSPFLMATKMGVLEMVEEILKQFPVAIEDENQDEKNVVLLAAEHRQPRVYNFLKNKYSTKESVFQKVDKAGNSAPHLAATFGEHQPWMIPGAALQMQWEIKWYEFIKESMPRHFFARLNKEGKTPNEVFTVQHIDLIKAGGEWLTHTSESCSVVAALIATVAFASATTLPGGVKEGGKPTFEGKPAFNVFAISSLVALCFSTTSLTMFLSILTSRYQVSDFHYSLPTKLIVGLTSLFVSIASMLVSFCAGHFFVLSYQLKFGIYLVYGITCLPVTLFAIAQFPLYLDLLKSTMTPVPKRSYEVVSI